MLGQLGAPLVVARAAGIGTRLNVGERNAEIHLAAGFTISSSQVSMRGMMGQASVTLDFRPTAPLLNADTLNG